LIQQADVIQKFPTLSNFPNLKQMIDDKTFDELRKQLPFLPGNTFDRKDIRPNERKSHAFDYSKQIPVYRAEAAGIGIDLFDI
jgi:hypothetical protein